MRWSSGPGMTLVGLRWPKYSRTNDLFLGPKYRFKTLDNLFIRCLSAISHVNVTDVPEVFDLLVQDAPEQDHLDEVITYFEHDYIRGTRRAGRGNHYGEPVFKHKVWNQHKKNENANAVFNKIGLTNWVRVEMRGMRGPGMRWVGLRWPGVEVTRVEMTEDWDDRGLRRPRLRWRCWGDRSWGDRGSDDIDSYIYLSFAILRLPCIISTLNHAPCLIGNCLN